MGHTGDDAVHKILQNKNSLTESAENFGTGLIWYPLQNYILKDRCHTCPMPLE